MNNRELDNIFNSCLERLAGGTSITDCLKDYPEQAGELEPLLQTAALARRTLTDIKPDSRFKTAARFRMAWIRYLDEAYDGALALLDARPELLTPDGEIIVQIHPKEYEKPALEHLERVDSRRYGSVQLDFYRRRER